MCTVSIVPLADGFRLGCHRDELHARPAALPPRAIRLDRGLATMPIDPQGGGSWIALTDAGLALALLNRMTPAALLLEPHRRTRGEIVTLLAAARGLDEAKRVLRAIDPGAYRPFQLVTVAGGEVMTATSDGAGVEVVIRPLRLPRMFTSSSLGDASAQRMRGPLFEALVMNAEDRLAGQQAFHAHRWPRCGAFSVVMCRDDARTVSRSTIDVRGGSGSFAYEALARETSCQRLPRR